MKLIDADELLTDNTWEWFDEWGNCTAAGKAIMDAPTIDAAPIVRCKDCKHASECHKSVQYTRNEQNTVTIGYSPIEWCSRGERREP